MPLLEIDWHPTPRQLRQFGAICLGALPLLAWWWGGRGLWLAAAAGIGVLLLLLGWLLPAALRPLFLGLMLVAWPIGLVVGELAMLLVYFGLFTPLGWLLRLRRRDRLQLRLERDAATYWIAKKPPAGPASYFRQS